MTHIEGPIGPAITAPSAVQILTEIGKLIDCEVELVARWTTAGAVYMIVPADRKRLRSAFWQTVRTDPSAGVWKSLEAALVGFAARSIGWLQASRRRSASAVQRFVQEQLGQARSAPAWRVLAAAHSAGISAATLHRAATRLGVRRRKISMTEGWMWTLPAEGELKYSTGATDE